MYELTRAEQLYQQNRYDESVALLQSVLAQDPHQSQAKFLLIMSWIHMGELTNAEKEIQLAISESPDDDWFFYAKAILEYEKEDVGKARKAIEMALSIDPTKPPYYGLLSHIQIYYKQFEEALKTANLGLDYDPENEQCLNAKGDALTKLGRLSEAEQIFKDSLSENPENSDTFAHSGYSLLERGQYKEALVHFKQSLALDPNNHLAIEGIKIAVKSKFFLYRWLLNISFALNKLPGKVQMFLVVGLYFAYQFLNRMADKNPDIEPFIQPFLYVYLIFVFSSWFLTPLANFVLRMHSFGKYALNTLEKNTSAWVGSLLILSLVSGVARLILADSFPTFPSIFFLFMAMAASATGMLHWKKDRKKMLYLSISLAIIGFLGLFQEAVSGQWGLFNLLFIGGVIGLQLYVNYLMARR